MQSLPPKFNVPDKFCKWLDRVRDFVASQTLIAGKGIRLTGTPRGTIITATAVGGGSNPAATKTTGINWKGLYSHTNAYNQYDMVYVANGASNSGIWLNVQAGGSVSYDPVYPMPATPVWFLISLGIQTASVCVGGVSKNVDFNASPPY